MTLALEELTAMTIELMKLANTESVVPVPSSPVAALPEKKPAKEKGPEHPLMSMGKAVGAYTLGTGLGYGGLMAADLLSQKYRGLPVVTSEWSHAAPHLVGALGLATHMAQQGMFDRFRNHQEYKEKKRREQNT